MKPIFVFLALSVLFSSQAFAIDLLCECVDCTPVEVSIDSSQWMKVTTRGGEKTVEGSAIKTTTNNGDIEYFRLGRMTLHRELDQWTIVGTAYTCKIQ